VIVLFTQEEGDEWRLFIGHVEEMKGVLGEVGGGGYHHGEEEGEMSVFMMAASGDVGSLVFATFTPKSSKSFCI
jgi:hypothetical protein